MSGLQLELTDARVRYRPGEAVEGVASWDLAAAPQAFEIRLYWRTQGKGTVDVEVVRSSRVPNPQAQGRHLFRLELPASPYSFSGPLISLLWGVELVAEPKGESANLEITMSPTGEEVRLDRRKPT